MQDSSRDNIVKGNEEATSPSFPFSNPQAPAQASIEDLLRQKAQQQAQQQAALRTQTPAFQAAHNPNIQASTLKPAVPPSKENAPPASSSVSAQSAIRPAAPASSPSQQSQQLPQINASAVPQKTVARVQTKNYLERAAGIKVIGVGGAGCNAIERMMEDGMTGVEFIAVNTDAQALSFNHANTRIVIGDKVTKGRGAGSDPEMGKRAMEQNLEELKAKISGADIVFIAAGMGGGTGTGAAPLIADIAKKTGALTIAVVTKPFPFEGTHRQKIAREGIMELASRVDTLITVPNDRLLSIANKDMTLIAAFRKVDDILRSGVRGITDIILKTGIINVDFADIQSVLLNGGPSQVGIGYASGQDRAVLAAQNAIFSPLLETSIDGAKAILFNITGDSSMSLHEIKAAADIIVNAADPEARIVFGSVIDETLTGGEISITVIATGLTGDTERELLLRDPRSKESAESINSQMPSFPSADDDMDMPAILRRNRHKLMS